MLLIGATYLEKSSHRQQSRELCLKMVTFSIPARLGQYLKNPTLFWTFQVSPKQDENVSTIAVVQPALTVYENYVVATGFVGMESHQICKTFVPTHVGSEATALWKDFSNSHSCNGANRAHEAEPQVGN